jgi:hypothetical protein
MISTYQNMKNISISTYVQKRLLYEWQLEEYICNVCTNCDLWLPMHVSTRHEPPLKGYICNLYFWGLHPVASINNNLWGCRQSLQYFFWKFLLLFHTHNMFRPLRAIFKCNTY